MTTLENTEMNDTIHWAILPNKILCRAVVEKHLMPHYTMIRKEIVNCTACQQMILADDARRIKDREIKTAYDARYSIRNWLEVNK